MQRIYYIQTLLKKWNGQRRKLESKGTGFYLGLYDLGKQPPVIGACPRLIEVQVTSNWLVIYYSAARVNASCINQEDMHINTRTYSRTQCMRVR